jgi:nicotinate-nucleotide pyrophosphorylase (carboxylating)
MNAQIRAIVSRALKEDMPQGDITVEALFADQRAGARLIAKEQGIVSGLEVAREVFFQIDPNTVFETSLKDGVAVSRGDVIASVSGLAASLLKAERVALNFLQRMSGIATTTRRYQDACAGTRASIHDTRKTTPGLRAFERHAVVDGGGHNHRYSLSDAVMAKDNHLAVLAEKGVSVTAALQGAIARLSHTTHVEVEVDRLDQIEAVLAAGIGTIMLDNFSLEDLRRGVEQVGGRATVEASGGVSLKTVRAIAETGVDVISVGALTHSARALDLGLDVRIS